jgi:hypothetical protein
MKKLLITLALFALTIPCFSQHAKVVELKPSEVTRIKSLYNQRDQIAKEINEFESQIRKTYITDCSEKSCNLKPGWEWGFEYSEDYKFIVPIRLQLLYSSGYINNGCLTSGTNSITTPNPILPTQ